MSEPIEMTGWVSAKKEVRTLKDLRDLVAWCDQYKLKDESVVDYGGGPYLYVDFMGEDEVSKATWIECGDHLWGDEQWDVLIETHRHPEHEQPAIFDWPTKDRAIRAASLHRTAADYCHDNGHSYADAEDICYLCGAKS